MHKGNCTKHHMAITLIVVMSELHSIEIHRTLQLTAFLTLRGVSLPRATELDDLGAGLAMASFLNSSFWPIWGEANVNKTKSWAKPENDVWFINTRWAQSFSIHLLGNNNDITRIAGIIDQSNSGLATSESHCLQTVL